MTNYKKNQPVSTSQQLLNEHGKIPPQAVDIEEYVIGACMLESGAYDNIAHILNADYFYKEAHQIIFKAIETLSKDNKPVDLMTVTEQLKVNGNLEMVGGVYHITTLTARIASSSNIEYHAYIIYQKFIERKMINLCGNLMKTAFEDDFDTMNEIYHSATEELDTLLAGKKADKDMYQIMVDHQKEVDKRIVQNLKGEMTGVKTGLVYLNKITNGWKPGELIIVAGRPGMGKTAVALNLFAKKAALQQRNVLFFSLEMDDMSLADRLVCSYGGINSYNLKTGKLADDELQNYHNAANELQKLPIYIDDSARVDIKHITAVSRAKRRKGECDMIVIDYLQLIETKQTNGWQKNREREVAEMSRGLKLLAKELKVPVLLLAQLNRGVESRANINKRPMLSDLRESGAIEQDADMVIFPYRPEYYGIIEDDAGNSTVGVMILVIAKNRNGRTGDVFARYSEDLTQITDFETQPF